MIPTTHNLALLFFLSIVPFSIGMPQTPVIDPLFCALCSFTSLPFPCASKGLEFAVQAHTFQNNDATFSSVDITHFQKTAPAQRGFTKRIGWVGTDPTVTYSIYDQPATNAQYKAVHHRAYFVPPADGIYKLSATTFDDMLVVWVGDNAYSGKYTRDNAALVLLLGQTAKPLEIEGVVGVPMAFRMLFVNAYGAANFQISITKPDGTVLMDAGGAKETPFFIPYTCDGTSPAFKDWGKETA